LPVILSSRRLPDLKATTSGLLTPTSSNGDLLNGTTAATADNNNNNLDSLADLGHVSTSDLMATLDDRELRMRTPPTAIKPTTRTRSISPTRNDGNGIMSSNQHDSFSTEDLLQSLPGPTITTTEVAPPSLPPTAPSTSTTTITSPTNTRRKSKPKLEPFSFAPDEKVVLVVDDNQVNLKIIGKMLTHFHLEYHTAENGRIAADKVIERSSSSSSNNGYALVLMDICMPVMDGYSSIQEIRRHDSCRDIPIIALTANALSTERDRAVEVGANGFQTKPILRHDLHALCKRLLMTTTNTTTMEGDGEDARKHVDLLGPTMMNGGTNGINGTTENNGVNLINASTAA